MLNTKNYKKKHRIKNSFKKISAITQHKAQAVALAAAEPTPGSLRAVNREALAVIACLLDDTEPDDSGFRLRGPQHADLGVLLVHLALQLVYPREQPLSLDRQLLMYPKNFPVLFRNHGHSRL